MEKKNIKGEGYLPFVNALCVTTAGSIFDGSDADLFRSTDDGLTWVSVVSELTKGGSSMFFNSIVSTSENVILANGMTVPPLLSRDNGETWKPLGSEGVANFLAASTSGVVLAASGPPGGIFKADLSH